MYYIDIYIYINIHTTYIYVYIERERDLYTYICIGFRAPRPDGKGRRRGTGHLACRICQSRGPLACRRGVVIVIVMIVYDSDSHNI